MVRSRLRWVAPQAAPRAAPPAAPPATPPANTDLRVLLVGGSHRGDAVHFFFCFRSDAQGTARLPTFQK
eukprot:2665536-Prymnesium_polylepis.1